MKKIFLFALISLFMAGCHSAIKVSSVLPQNEQETYRYYDPESRVRYKVSNDEKYLYITLNTVDEASIYKIMRTGLWFYFNANGKSKRNIFVQYPVIETADNPKETEVEFNPEPIRLRTEIPNLQKEAIFQKDKQIETVSTLVGGIQIVLTTPAANELTYRLQVPFSKITDVPFTELQAMHVGVVSGGIEKKMEFQSQQQNNYNPNGMPGATGGNMMSGTMATSNTGTMHLPIEFWMDINLVHP